MKYEDIFEAYYTQYRAEADVPDNSDDEFAIGIPLANEAINRWANYDNTMWLELFDTNIGDGSGDSALVAGQTEYAGPTNMKIAGGNVKVIDPDGKKVKDIPIIQAEDAQFMGDMANYCYFTGNQATGFTLNINPAPLEAFDGYTINYVYYKTPTLIKNASSRVEMSDPYFIVHRMLANRFRASRNPYYTSAKADAEDSLRTMQLTNNSGNWANPWTVPDPSGSSWGG